MAPTAPKAKFTENEKVLCYHGPLLYEAKCVKIKKEAGIMMYFVHYQGWNKNWDEWVNESRILKINAENLEKKDKLQSAVKEGKKKGTPKPNKKSKSTDSASNSRASTPVSDQSFKGATPGPSGSGTRRGTDDDLQSTSSRGDDRDRSDVMMPGSRKRHRNSTSNSLADDSADESGVDDDINSEVGGSIRGEREVFKIQLPEELKYVLVSDWDLVTHKKSLFNLPAKMTVNCILNEYKKHVEKSGDAENLSAVAEVMAGVRQFFDEGVGPILLYRIERPQYLSIVKQGDCKNPSDVYGSAHLLRLMVKIPLMLNQTHITGETDVKMIENVLGQFLQYLDTNRTRLFTSKNYSEASEEYLKSVDLG